MRKRVKGHGEGNSKVEIQIFQKAKWETLSYNSLSLLDNAIQIIHQIALFSPPSRLLICLYNLVSIDETFGNNKDRSKIFISRICLVLLYWQIWIFFSLKKCLLKIYERNRWHYILATLMPFMTYSNSLFYIVSVRLIIQDNMTC